MKKPTLVITHKDCFDGHTAAWIYSRFVERAAEFLPARYGDKAPYVQSRRVVIADFSYPREDMLRIMAMSSECVVLDHHKTAQEALVGLLDEASEGLDHISRAEWQLSHEVVFDMERSGAGLVWDYFCAQRQFCEVCGATSGHIPGCELSKRPDLVNYVEDRDLWRMALPKSHEYNANVYAAPMTFEGWDALYSRSLNEMIGRGEAILAYMDQYGTKALKMARRRSVRGVNTDLSPWTVNIPYMNCSDYLSRLMEEKGCDFVMGYFCREDGRWQFSLRSRNDFDCSAVAKQFGGGGHKYASGFDVGLLSDVFA